MDLEGGDSDIEDYDYQEDDVDPLAENEDRDEVVVYDNTNVDDDIIESFAIVNKSLNTANREHPRYYVVPSSFEAGNSSLDLAKSTPVTTEGPKADPNPGKATRSLPPLKPLAE